MRIVEPVLLVSGDDEMAMANYAKDSWKNDWDVFVPYEYQRKHFELIFTYVAPEYYNKCPVKGMLEDTIKEMEESPYCDYFKYFLVTFMIEHGEYDPEVFHEWLNKNHPLYIGSKADILRYYEVKRYYQTIIRDLNIGDGNKWNKLMDLIPNYFGKHIILYLLQYLSEGGKLVFLNIEGNMKTMFDYTRKGYEELEEGVFRKKPTPKKKFKLPRSWL